VPVAEGERGCPQIRPAIWRTWGTCWWAGTVLPVQLARDLMAQGFSPDEIARLTRAGDLKRIRHGAYVPAAMAVAEDRELHRRLVRATVRLTSPEAVVSHESASVVHGLPFWPEGVTRVHLTRDRPTGAKKRAHVQQHTGSLGPADVTEVDGIRVTSLPRTVVDLGRSLPLMRSVPVADAAMADGLRRDELDEALTAAGGRTGIGAARRMAALADARSESVGESASRVVLLLNGIPAPQLQYEVFDPGGELVARADFCWEDQRTLGEFDGKIKYGRLLRPGQSASDVVYAEKLREDRLRDLGWQVVRWSWDDLYRPRVLVERLERAFSRGRLPL
jgi:hypothetical protein